VLELLRRELELAMALVGCSQVATIDRSLVAMRGEVTHDAVDTGLRPAR
jgi:isopentenyl diphosphate isomerase/L-lactate dehydrogenase-like FMN-dependent dehydrogenase